MTNEKDTADQSGETNSIPMSIESTQPDPADGLGTTENVHTPMDPTRAVKSKVALTGSE